MENTQVLTVSWQALTAIGGILMIVVGACTAYLNLAFKSKLGDFGDKMMGQIKQEFQNKETSTINFQELRERVREIGERVSKLEGAVYKHTE